MRYFRVPVLCMFLMFVVAVGAVHAGTGNLTIAVSFTVLEDFVQQVAGPDSDVRCIVPVGAEVHDWELTAANLVDVSQADIVFYNGLNLEQWVRQIGAALSDSAILVSLAKTAEVEYLPIVSGMYQGDPDPHLWMDPRRAVAYIETIRDALVALDPARADQYQENAASYIQELLLLHERLQETAANFPSRLLITSEAAFLYFADAYGFAHDGIWGTNTEQEGTPRQLQRIMTLIYETPPPAIFWESTGSDRHARSVARDGGIPLAGPLYVDSVGRTGSGAESYIGMMDANMVLIKSMFVP